MKQNKDTIQYQRILQHELADRCQRNARYSLRAFAKTLSVAPGFLSDVINGKKPLSLDYAEKIANNLELDTKTKSDFINSVIQYQNKRKLKRRDPKLKNYASTVPHKVDNSVFDHLNEWYYFAILNLVKIESSKDDAKWFASQLGISVHESKLALDKLNKLGFLKREKQKFVRTQTAFTTSNNALTTEALKKRQRQIREKAIEALDSVPIELRSMSSITMCIDPSKISKAKERIVQFQNDMSEFLESENTNKVYSMEISLFPLQKLGES